MVVNIELNRHNPSPITVVAVLYYILLSFRYDQENRKVTVTRFCFGHYSNGITTAY